MNTSAIAKEYRLSHWAGIIRERTESGLSIRDYCKQAGFHENIYFYWQRKLREATCREFVKIESETLIPTTSFAEVKLAQQPLLPQAVVSQRQVCLDSAGVRITAGSEYPVDKLAALLREVLRP